jgi:WD40 repeat protein
LSGSHDGTARQWDAENGETILAPIKTGHEWVFAVIYSPDMTMFASSGSQQHWNNTGDNKYPVKVRDTKTGELVVTLEEHTHWVMCLSWTRDGKTPISGSGDRSIRKWSTTTWKQIAALDGHTNGCSCHCNIPEWPHHRKRIVGQDSAIMES